MGLFDDLIPANREVDLLTRIAMSLSNVSDMNLIEPRAIVDRSPAIPLALAEWLEYVVTWERGRREGRSHPLQTPEIDPAEAQASTETLAAFNDAFEHFVRCDPSRLDGTRSFLKAVDAVIKLDAMLAAGTVH